MENASKALMIAGGIMLTMLVISLLLYITTSITEYQTTQEAAKETQRVAEFNKEYTNFARDNIQGYELLSLINKVIDYNQRYSSEFDESNKTSGNMDQYKPITLSVKLDESESDYTKRNEFTTTIVVPAKAKSEYEDEKYDQIKDNNSHSEVEEKPYNGMDVRLFNEPEYKQDNAINKLKDILDTVTNIESTFGGATNAQNITKNINTIFSSKVIFYNGQPEDIYEEKNWYQQTYIENRYKALTGKKLSIDDIRSESIVKQALQYYEFVEFKKAKFNCTGVIYDNGTGRVTGISFEIKE